MPEKQNVSIQLERAENLPESLRAELGIVEGLVIKKIESNSPAQPARIAAMNSSYIDQLNLSLTKIDIKTVLKEMDKVLN